MKREILVGQGSPAFPSHCEVGYVDRPDGGRIRYGMYMPSGGSLKRAVVFLNGRAEWMEKYVELPESLNLPPDTAYLTMDHRGQGGSTGDRAYIDSYTTYVDDVKAVLDQVLKGRVPYSLLGHSTGCLIALYGVFQRKLLPKTMVLSSPLLGLRRDPLAPVVGWPIMEFLSLTPLLKWNMPFEKHAEIGFAKNVLTHNEAMFDRVCATPYPMPGPACGWVRASYRATSWVHSSDQIGSLDVPTLVMATHNDRVVNPQATVDWVAKAKSQSKVPVDVRWFDDGHHELLAELPAVCEKAVAAARSWIGQYFLDDVSAKDLLIP